MNAPRAKGTRAETALVKWARANGFAAADRQPLRGGRDQGDVVLCPGVIAEVKSHRLPTGTPTRGQLTDWMGQTETERANARADIGILVVKRPGTADPGAWFAYLAGPALADLISGAWPGGNAPICLALADLVDLLRGCGWGDEPGAGYGGIFPTRPSPPPRAGYASRRASSSG